MSRVHFSICPTPDHSDDKSISTTSYCTAGTKESKKVRGCSISCEWASNEDALTTVLLEKHGRFQKMDDFEGWMIG